MMPCRRRALPLQTQRAADLPVKAKPVEYVKVCSVYGAGFYYIPGTDTCIKVGGFVRAEYNINANGSHTPYFNGANSRETRADTNSYNTRTRGIVSFDARSQTSYGTLRSYIRAGWELNSADASYRGISYFDRAFIQFAGLTVGKTQSFFDFYANALNYTTSVVGGSDTGHGINLIAYTAQFGGGFSGTLSLEDQTHRRSGIWDASVGGNALVVAGIPGGALGPNTMATGDYAGQRYPDVVGNLRVDQPWGSAQIMAALHDASGGCVGPTCNPGGISTNAGNATGFAVGGGLMLNVPWAQGDQFWLQGTFARGAASYIGFNTYVSNNVFGMYSNGGAGAGAIGSFGGGWGLDGVFDGTGAVSQTEGFQVNAAFQHFWTPSLRTSIWGGVASLRYPGAAATKFCNGAVSTAAGSVAAVPAGCNPNFSVTQIGTRTIWSPVANLDIGVEVMYSRLDQNMVGNWALASNGSRAAGLYTARDQDTWNAVLRFQRNFWP
jgi:hypothetical protein